MPNLVTLVCQNQSCQREFTAVYGKRYRKFCSTSCADPYRVIKRRTKPENLFKIHEPGQIPRLCSGSVRGAMLRAGIREECALCKLGPTWNDNPLVLQIDHINAIKHDMRLENLRLLCPNCHSQTPTFGVGNTSKKGT